MCARGPRARRSAFCLTGTIERDEGSDAVRRFDLAAALVVCTAAAFSGCGEPRSQRRFGRVVDARTRQPLPGAVVSQGSRHTRTDAVGMFELDRTADSVCA